MNNIDWAELINCGFESKNLDYKEALEWSPNTDKKSCCELVKDILAIANFGGGWIIIGVKEDKEEGKGFIPVGLSDPQAGSFESTALNQFVNKYADPPVNVLVHKPRVDGKVFIVIQVQGFNDTPHICQKDYPDVLRETTLYIRTDNNESAPIKSSADFRGIIERTTREVVNPKEQFEKQIKESEKKCDSINPHLKKGYGYRETAFFPDSFIQNRFDMTTLRKMIENTIVNLRGWPFIFYHESRPDLIYAFEEGLETKIVGPNLLTGGDDFHFWRLYESGLLFTKEILWEDKSAALGKGTDYIDFDSASLLAGEAVNCLVRLYEGLIDDSEQVFMRFRVTGTNGRKIQSSNRSIYLEYLTPCQIDSIKYEASHSYGEWKAGIVDHALEICKYAFERFNWNTPELGASKILIEKMLGRQLT